MGTTRHLKVLIVEDSLLTRVGIAAICNWEENGFTLVGDAENGRQALELIERDPPDIILTDVKMPVMGGLALLREVKKRNLKTRFIMLSAYDDFSLVREALQLGADDYLLKMELEAESLLRPFQRLAGEILQEEAACGKPSATDAVSAGTAAEYLRGILTGETAEQADAKEFWQITDFPPPPAPLYCIVSARHDGGIADTVKSPIMLDQAVVRIMCELFYKYGVCSGCVLKLGYHGILFSPGPDKLSADPESLQRLCSDVSESVHLTFGAELSVSFAQVESMEALPSLCESLCANTDQNNILLPPHSPPVAFFGMQLSRIEEVLENLRFEQIESTFEELTAVIQKGGRVLDKQLYGVSHTLIHVVDSFVSRNRYLEIPWNRSNELLHIAKNCHTTIDYSSWISELGKRLSAATSSENEARIILRAKKFINENYQNDISLESVSQFVNISPAYFSRLFVGKTAENFIDYLTNVRIDHAKQYLRSTNKKIIEISEMVGYSNSYYFSRIFKRITGMSPMEYRHDV